MEQLQITDDLAVVIGNRRAQLSPGEALRTAERLIRRATVRMIEEEADNAAAASGRTPACAE
jgi:hypothetical protein